MAWSGDSHGLSETVEMDNRAAEVNEHVRTGEEGFALHFEHMPWEKRHGISLDDPGEDPMTLEARDDAA
jgi:hypothetical protein